MIGNNKNKRPGKNNLLAITSTYNYFVKDQIESICNDFNSIEVFVYHNPVTELANFLPLRELGLFTKRSLIEPSGKPGNISVSAVPAFYLPTDRQYIHLGERHFRKIDKIISEKKLQFNLIHSHFAWTSGHVGMRLKEKYDMPLVVSCYGYDLYDLPLKSEEWKSRISDALNAANCIVTVSNSLAECARKLEVMRPIVVLPTGYDSNRFYPRDPLTSRRLLNLPENRKIIISIGSLVKVKGHKILIQAVGELVKQQKDILCIILGDGNLRSDLQNEIKKRGLEKNIIIVGRQPREELPLWINASDVFVLSSLNEGNPTVMFESLGCGVPFVSTNVGGVKEIITSEDYGLICDSNDAQGLKDKIFKALDKSWDRDLIYSYASNFRWDKQRERLLEIYESCS